MQFHRCSNEQNKSLLIQNQELIICKLENCYHDESFYDKAWWYPYLGYRKFSQDGFDQRMLATVHLCSNQLKILTLATIVLES